MIKWVIMIWLLIAGVGNSFSIMKERKQRLSLLKEMEESLHKMIYYMYRFKMPVEEAFRHVAEEQKEELKEFFLEMHHMLQNKTVDNMGDLWQENSKRIEREISLPGEVRQIWENCFTHIPEEPEGLRHSLIRKAEEIKHLREDLKEKYESEQKLVLTLGVFASAFFCLILW